MNFSTANERGRKVKMKKLCEHQLFGGEVSKRERGDEVKAVRTRPESIKRKKKEKTQKQLTADDGQKGDRRQDDKDFARRGWTGGVFLTSLSSAASSSHATGLSAGLVRAVFNGRMAAGIAKKDLPWGSAEYCTAQARQ